MDDAYDPPDLRGVFGDPPGPPKPDLCPTCVHWHPIRQECPHNPRKVPHTSCWSFKKRIRPFRASTQTKHGSLIEMAAKWLARQGYSVVTTDVVASELADAIGFATSESCLIECKASRSDFAADAKKYFRQNPEKGMGKYRYYLTPPGLLSLDELPAGWGLLEDHDGHVRRLKHSEGFVPRAADLEVALLVSVMRRLRVPDGPGVMIKVYEVMGRNDGRATVGIEREEPSGDEREVSGGPGGGAVPGADAGPAGD